MKLNEIKSVMLGDYNLNEGVIPVAITMTLEQVISAGKVTNSVQTFIMAGLVSMFKDGGPTRWPRDINSYSMATGADLIEAVKGLNDGEAVEMAKWLLSELVKPATFESNPCTNPTMGTQEWVRWVLQKQK
jgi:hypothetical protein